MTAELSCRCSLRVLNVHDRNIAAPPDAVGALIDSLASDDDALWPSRTWPRMCLDRPLNVGAIGGHGPIRSFVDEYLPGRMVQFRFLSPRGFDGHHRFEATPAENGSTLLRHTIDMSISGRALFTWPVIVRPLHDALLEDALNQAQSSLGLTPAFSSWSAYVKLLRWLVTSGRAKPPKHF